MVNKFQIFLNLFKNKDQKKLKITFLFLKIIIIRKTIVMLNLISIKCLIFYIIGQLSVILKLQKPINH